MNNYFNPEGVRRRILRGIGANVFGQVVSVAIQILSVPLFLHYWGAVRYGEWLILSTLPVYIGLSDIGLASVVGNEMTMANTKFDKKRAIEVYQSAWAMIGVVTLFILIILSLVIYLVSPRYFGKITSISFDDARLIIFILSLQSIISVQGGLFLSAFRSIGENARGVSLGNLVRLFEWIAAVFALILYSDPLIVAVVLLSFRLLGTSFVFLMLRRSVPWLNIGVSNFTKKTAFSLLKPAFAFFSFPVGLSINLQGVVLIIGIFLGPAAVAIFSAYRTYSRVLIQAVTALNQSAWPEISAYFSENKIENVRVNFLRMLFFSFWTSLIGGGIFSLFAAPFFDKWMAGRADFDALFLLGLIITAIVNVWWQPAWVVLMAINSPP